MGVESPCINVCKMDAQSGLCQGCFRSLDEIAAWSGASETERQRIVVAAHRRAAFASAGAFELAPGGTHE